MYDRRKSGPAPHTAVKSLLVEIAPYSGIGPGRMLLQDLHNLKGYVFLQVHILPGHGTASFKKSEKNHLFFTLSKISSSVSPVKGASPQSKIYIKTPQDHSSQRSSYKLSTTSGEQYILVPIIPFNFLFLFF